MKPISTFSGTWIVFFALSAAAEPLETPGTIDAVTVYRGQALVTRIVEIPPPAGLREIVVTDLPEHVVAASLYASAGAGVGVRSVRYRTRPVREDLREEVRELDAKIREAQDALSAVDAEKAVLSQQQDYLAKLEQFVAPTAAVDLSRGVLDATALVTLSDYLRAQRTALAKAKLAAEHQARDLREQLDLFTRQRSELTRSSARTAREAVVFVDLQSDTGAHMELRYLVEKASWTPSYNIRTEDERGNVLVEYNASVQQMSGEDWSDVTMRLSTATPSLVATAPLLEPLWITLRPLETQTEEVGQQVRGPADYKGAKRLITDNQRRIEAQRNIVAQALAQGEIAQPTRAAEPSEQSLDLVLNQYAADLQMLDLQSGEAERSTTDRGDAGISVTYTLAERSSLPSRADQQLIRIATAPMTAQFYRVATPVLTGYVYEQARVTNSSALVLLGGPVSSYIAGQFVGHGEIPTVAAGQEFTVGFGIDSSLRTSRELINKTETVQGGNRVVDFTYRLVLDNFGSNPVVVRLTDRLPSAKEADVKLTLVSPGQELSADPTYQQTDRKKGILRWDVEVPAQSFGTGAFALDYQFRLEYDRQMSVSGMPIAQ